MFLSCANLQSTFAPIHGQRHDRRLGDTAREPGIDAIVPIA
jgi:hypothetical protein